MPERTEKFTETLKAAGVRHWNNYARSFLNRFVL